MSLEKGVRKKKGNEFREVGEGKKSNNLRKWDEGESNEFRERGEDAPPGEETSCCCTNKLEGMEV